MGFYLLNAVGIRGLRINPLLIVILLHSSRPQCKHMAEATANLKLNETILRFFLIHRI